MSRTDDLRRDGAKERGGGGGGTPFVRWGESYGWVEGRVTEVWGGKYGLSATLAVTGVSDGLQAVGKTEEGEKYSRLVKGGTEVNVGLNYAALRDSITAADKGKHMHVAFEGWGETKSEDRFRMFTVLEIPAPQNLAKPSQNVRTAAQVKSDAEEPWPDDNLMPF